MRGLVWFREDLRTRDNSALFFASQQCKAGIIGIYIIDHEFWKKHHIAACRVEFILRGLKQISIDLNNLNIPLLIFEVKKTQEISNLLLSLIKKYHVEALFLNRQYEFNEMKRDKVVEENMGRHKIACYTYDDQTILPPAMLRTQQGDYFKVFTPYKKAWYKAFRAAEITIRKIPKKQQPLGIISSEISKVKTFNSSIDPSLWPSGEAAAQKRLKYFIETQLSNYDKQRDFPFIDGTSRLSPYLAAGMISARQCFVAALSANHYELDTGNKGAVIWMSELIWREFYKQILMAVPRISMGRAYKINTEQLPWNYNPEHLQAWQMGRTGFPIIDAAMRQLNTTGWMHNRLRMITATFLAKNLFLDWRLGEEYFMSRLIDGDLAANNGGWQWCASTGTDAAPYFRVFNPIRQSERFDPEGDFIRQYCPELSKLDKKSIHDPYKHNAVLAKKLNYPQPMIDLSSTRKKVIEAFKRI